MIKASFDTLRSMREAIWFHRTYSEERRHFRGNPSLPRGEAQTSIAFFTTNKCASTYVEKMVKYLCKTVCPLTPVNLPTYIWNRTSHPVYPYLADKSAELFREKGFFYAPLRQYINLSDVGDFRSILMLRDPRDVLVSNYYSRIATHASPRNKERNVKFSEDRSLAQSMSIDEFVLHRAPHFLTVYSTYKRHLADRCHGPVLRYEDLILDFGKWCDDLELNLQETLGSETRQHLHDLGGFSEIQGEDVGKHIRKAIPGDYSDKLLPRTQSVLKSQFSEILRWLNYED